MIGCVPDSLVTIASQTVLADTFPTTPPDETVTLKGVSASAISMTGTLVIAWSDLLYELVKVVPAGILQFPIMGGKWIVIVPVALVAGFVPRPVAWTVLGFFSVAVTCRVEGGSMCVLVSATLVASLLFAFGVVLTVGPVGVGGVYNLGIGTRPDANASHPAVQSKRKMRVEIVAKKISLFLRHTGGGF